MPFLSKSLRLVLALSLLDWLRVRSGQQQPADAKATVAATAFTGDYAWPGVAG